MQSLFEKFIHGKCSEGDYREVIQFIQNRNNDLLLSRYLSEEWKEIAKGEPAIKPDERLLNSIHHRIALNEKYPTRIIRLYRQMLAVASVLLVGLIIGSLIFIQLQKPPVTVQNVSTPFGARTQIVLPDGSNVWLNSGSTFSYPDRFKEERVVELDGEAYFSVEKQESPFIVKTQYGEVKVLGTAFNVKAYDNETFSTTLEKGSVVFTNKYGRQAQLEPGMQVIFDEKNFKLRRVETRLFTSWKDGQLIFRDEPLKNMVTQLERWYNVKIELKDQNISNLKFTGTLEMETFSEVMELIKVTTPIKYTFDRKTRVLAIMAQ